MEKEQHTPSQGHNPPGTHPATQISQNIFNSVRCVRNRFVTMHDGPGSSEDPASKCFLSCPLDVNQSI